MTQFVISPQRLFFLKSLVLMFFHRISYLGTFYYNFENFQRGNFNGRSNLKFGGIVTEKIIIFEKIG